jgi:hypothetical protein
VPHCFDLDRDYFLEALKAKAASKMHVLLEVLALISGRPVEALASAEGYTGDTCVLVPRE